MVLGDLAVHGKFCHFCIREHLRILPRRIYGHQFRAMGSVRNDLYFLVCDGRFCDGFRPLVKDIVIRRDRAGYDRLAKAPRSLDNGDRFAADRVGSEHDSRLLRVHQLLDDDRDIDGTEVKKNA